jgi:hypothetical protein
MIRISGLEAFFFRASRDRTGKMRKGKHIFFDAILFFHLANLDHQIKKKYRVL